MLMIGGFVSEGKLECIPYHLFRAEETNWGDHLLLLHPRFSHHHGPGPGPRAFQALLHKTRWMEALLVLAQEKGPEDSVGRAWAWARARARARAGAQDQAALQSHQNSFQLVVVEYSPLGQVWVLRSSLDSKVAAPGWYSLSSWAQTQKDSTAYYTRSWAEAAHSS
ncbi:uncharacterized protein G2W53_030230 [Senna tora]|uniref:Uncharacterized protein n=1 Tax=Senna tora TaxID=362788 RepID=A0A834WEE8_9FABA|nr:uncharacterized protein G2W53_030230 [Senna tora]